MSRGGEGKEKKKKNLESISKQTSMIIENPDVSLDKPHLLEEPGGSLKWEGGVIDSVHHELQTLAYTRRVSYLVVYIPNFPHVIFTFQHYEACEVGEGDTCWYDSNRKGGRCR
jgi:hypothetical protein